MEGQEATSSITGRTPADVAAGGKIQCFVHDFTIKAEGVTVDALHEKLSEWCKKWVFQLERGDTGYVHYQGRLTLIKKRRSTELASKFFDDLFKGWFSPTTNNGRDKEAFYCIKADTRVEGPWKDTDYQAPIVLTRQMLEFSQYTRFPWQNTVEGWVKEWNKRAIYWIYDEHGCNGKSDLVEWLDTNRLACAVPPMRNLEDILQFCFSYPSKAYLIDFPRAMKKESLLEFYAGLECLKNGFMYDKRYKGQKKWIDRPAVVVFSNTKPDLSSMSRDRWSVWSLEERDLVPLSCLAKASAAASVPLPGGGPEGAT